MTTQTGPFLTGRSRYRVGWRKRLVLQVEEGFDKVLPHAKDGKQATIQMRFWRDAQLSDMAANVRVATRLERTGESI